MREIIESAWGTEHFGSRLQDYAQQTDRELLATARLIGALYANMNRFDVFVELTLLYFAAASFAESARRLLKPHLATSFLLCTHPEFGPACEEICARARQRLSEAESEALIARIHAAIDPINVAGLGNPERRNWYPVEADDILNAAAKLDSSRDEVQALLNRCGFVCEPTSNRAAMA